MMLGKSMISLTDFNPRSREGSDNSTATVQTTDRISIRAPARGATLIAVSEHL